MHDKHIARALRLWKGVHPYLFPGDLSKEQDVKNWKLEVEDRISAATAFAQRRKTLYVGDRVVVVQGWRPGPGSTNTVSIIEVTDTLFDPEA